MPGAVAERDVQGDVIGGLEQLLERDLLHLAGQIAELVVGDLAVFRGALDVGATTINAEMELACIEGIAALARATTASAYGAMGALVLAMLWVYYAAVILYAGAVVTATIDERRGVLPPAAPSDGAPAGG